MKEDSIAITAHKNSIANAMAGNKEQWLELFDNEAVVYDPVGPSGHDPEGQGFRGIDQINKFWDLMIAPGNITVVPHKRIRCGDKIVAVVMTVTNLAGTLKTFTEMVGVYEVNDAGKITVLKVYWDVDALMEQLP
ncbi:MAG: nuclear transport factor 2 family protein [Halieaceae bacterium]|mgnify:FL=1|jgi:steroid Delta-isomerase|nr:nuclear transport factor 2 family protein [Halieaceae bacterium]